MGSRIKTLDLYSFPIDHLLHKLFLSSRKCTRGVHLPFRFSDHMWRCSEPHVATFFQQCGSECVRTTKKNRQWHCQNRQHNQWKRLTTVSDKNKKMKHFGQFGLSGKKKTEDKTQNYFISYFCHQCLYISFLLLFFFLVQSMSAILPLLEYNSNNNNDTFASANSWRDHVMLFYTKFNRIYSAYVEGR